VGSEKLVGEAMVRGLQWLEDKIENGISLKPNWSYFTSEEFLGTAAWMWLEMRKAEKGTRLLHKCQHCGYMWPRNDEK